QVWERVERVRADDLVSAEAGDLLHEPVPHLVAEVAVIDDDTLTDAADDGTREMLRLHQPPLRALAVGDIADDALIADDGAIRGTPDDGAQQAVEPVAGPRTQRHLVIPYGAVLLDDARERRPRVGIQVEVPCVYVHDVFARVPEELERRWVHVHEPAV